MSILHQNLFFLSVWQSHCPTKILFRGRTDLDHWWRRHMGGDSTQHPSDHWAHDERWNADSGFIQYCLRHQCWSASGRRMISSDRETDGLIVCILFLRGLLTFQCVHVFDSLAWKFFQRFQTMIHLTKRFYFIFKNWYRNDYYNVVVLENCLKNILTSMIVYLIINLKFWQLKSTLSLWSSTMHFQLFSSITTDLSHSEKNVIKIQLHIFQKIFEWNCKLHARSLCQNWKQIVHLKNVSSFHFFKTADSWFCNDRGISAASV